ncbi:MAG: hypothetical protein EoVTN8_609 [Fluviibacter phosphoraccumulans EoVTN8]
MNSTLGLPCEVILSVAMVVSKNTGQKGTGWLVSDRHLVTNEHVIRGAANDMLILYISLMGQMLMLKALFLMH